MGKLNRADAMKLGISVDTTSKSMQLTADHINTCLFKVTAVGIVAGASKPAWS